jgi:hypothetical protein
MGRLVAAMLASSFLSVSLPAQDRQPAFGTVADAAGKPVAGAEVVLWWTPIGEGLGPATDRVTATTDARGRFTAQLLPCRSYSAFARGAVQQDGSAQVSVVREGAAAHAQLSFALAFAAKRRTARLHGAEAWADEGPLRLVAVPSAANTMAVALPLLDGSAAVPPLPSVGFVVLDARGEPLWCQPERLDADVLQIELPAPYAQRVRVLDEHGAPAAGAELLLDRGPDTGLDRTSVLPVWSHVWRHVGTCGGDGTAILRLPVVPGPDGASFTLAAECHGCAGVSACNGDWFVDGVGDAPAADGVLPLHLRPRQRVRIVQSAKSLAARVSVLGGICMAERRRAGATGSATWGRPFDQRAHTDADGWIAPWPGGSETAFRVRLDPLVLPGESVPTVVDAHLPRAPGDVTVDVDRLRHLRVQLLDAGGGPAVAVRVFVLFHEPKLQSVPPCCTDAAGRVDLRLGDGGWTVFAWSRDSMAMQSLASGAGDADWRLTLEPLPRMQLRIVDAKGKPLADARTGLRWGGGMPQNANDEESLLMQLEQVVMQRLAVDRRSGADGRFDVPLLPFARIRWEVEVRADGHSSVQMPIEPNTEPRDVVLR